ncbi:hypothetical protein [Bacillus sp. 1P06AnD]|uniref:hypothetical protein n=1 Tax=Bacillus sp. 1P06AnD TaxID=3132208 RepID=UPI0039A1F447
MRIEVEYRAHYKSGKTHRKYIVMKVDGNFEDLDVFGGKSFKYLEHEIMKRNIDKYERVWINKAKKLR